MKIAREIIMKHMMHRAHDVTFAYEVDLSLRTVTVRVATIDTALIEWFLKFSLLHCINDEMQNQHAGHAEFANLSSFSIEIVVADKARFSLRLVERDCEPLEPTLVMRLKE
jgi:hypothetical protein